MDFERNSEQVVLRNTGLDRRRWWKVLDDLVTGRCHRVNTNDGLVGPARIWRVCQTEGGRRFAVFLQLHASSHARMSVQHHLPRNCAKVLVIVVGDDSPQTLQTQESALNLGVLVHPI